MKSLIYCLPAVFDDPQMMAMPGIARYKKAASIFGYWVMPVDRTHTITSPFHTTELYPLPEYRVFTKTYEEICNDRAREILTRATKLGVRIYALYSGGIDSTLLLVSLLKQATPGEKKNITVLLSHESIAENPRFFEEHIRGKLQVESSVVFANRIGGSDILLSAEHNDLVMGNATLGGFITTYTEKAIHEPYRPERMIEFFTKVLKGDTASARFYFELFDGLAERAPMPIVSNFDYLWWYNFTQKWQACFCYMLFFTSSQNAPAVTRDYLATRFISFYNTDEFQLWAMNSLDKRIRDTWKSYKWVLKDIIYDYTKDAEYRDHKTKVRSLPVVLKQQSIAHRYIDASAHFHSEFPSADFFVAKNDFV
ncbi:MAG: hypothetical protein WA021_03855 [Minisyncoccia bacterium]